MDSKPLEVSKTLTNAVGAAITKEMFSDITGLRVDVVRGMMYSGQLPTLKVGKRRLINYALFNKECLEEEFEF
ncbi:hypothetical protein [Agaribacterium sp. ZY112]|uniref:hypothetical protein n=1 Tax=Agaribacterium sp. ZY112 TaxID=3233574 RepID=UPI003523EC0F